MNFSTQIKQANTDEWYTPEEAVEIIVPFLQTRGYKKFYAHLIKQRAIL